MISIQSFPIPYEYFLPVPDCEVTSEHALLSDPGSLIYQENARRILSQHQPQDFRYFFENFEIAGPHEYVMMNVRNDEYCFSIRMRIMHWGNLTPLLSKSSYRYSRELLRVKWKILDEGGKQEVYFIEMHELID
ncbi:MAG: hypothetical protein AAF135_22655 [Bacteroidota bacterium]